MGEIIQTPPDARREETVQAIKSIEAGRFIASENVFAWLKTWGANTPADAPQCT